MSSRRRMLLLAEQLSRSEKISSIRLGLESATM